MTEITFDEIKVGDRIKAREVYKNGDTLESEFTVTDVNTNCAYSEHRGFPRSHGGMEGLTIERVQMPEPKKIGTVVEYMHNDDVETAVRYTIRDDVKYQWTRSDGFAITWEEILADDPNPKIKED